MDYFVAKSYVHEKLIKEIFELADKGFQVSGGVAIAFDAMGRLCYAQAMIKTTQQEELNAKANS